VETQEIQVEAQLVVNELLEQNQNLNWQLTLEKAKVKQLTNYVNQLAAQREGVADEVAGQIEELLADD
jgi:hypothetical protein